MTPNDCSSAAQSAFPDEPSPDQRRRFALWRAAASLSQAQGDGALNTDQSRLLEGLADTLTRLAAQMTELAALGHRYAELLAAQQAAPAAAPESHGERDGESESPAVA